MYIYHMFVCGHNEYSRRSVRLGIRYLFSLFHSFWAQPNDKHVPKAVPESCIPDYASIIVLFGSLFYGNLALYQL